MRVKAVILLIAPFIAYLLPSLVFSAELNEKLPLKGEITDQWFIIIEDNSSRIIPAELVRIDGQAMIKGFTNLADSEALIAAAVKLKSGDIYSTPLHKNGYMPKLSPEKAAQLKIKKLNEDLLQAKKELKIAQGLLYLETQRKREEAGLTQVDLIYEKIADIQQQIDSIESAYKAASLIDVKQ